jgi:hypothetical protein
LEECEKVLEDERKALLALMAEERKVEIDKDFQSMQQLSMKNHSDEVFIKVVGPSCAFISYILEKLILLLTLHFGLV